MTHFPCILMLRDLRAHGGETNSSWVLKGVMQFLTSPCKEAIVLRDHFVWKLVSRLAICVVLHCP